MEIDELLKGKSYRRGTAVFPSTRELVEVKNKTNLDYL